MKVFTYPRLYMTLYKGLCERAFRYFFESYVILISGFATPCYLILCSGMQSDSYQSLFLASRSGVGDLTISVVWSSPNIKRIPDASSQILISNRPDKNRGRQPSTGRQPPFHFHLTATDYFCGDSPDNASVISGSSLSGILA